MVVLEKSGKLKDERLFTVLYERYYEKAFSRALFYCGTKQMAEAAVQDVFLKIWKHIQQLLIKIKEWYSYLFVLKRNRVGNATRNENKREVYRMKYAMMMNPAVYDDQILDRECDKVSSEAIGRLSYQQKESFVLKYYRFKPKIMH